MAEESSNSFATRAIHVGQDPLQWKHGSVIPPVCMTTTYYQVMQCSTKVTSDHFTLTAYFT